MVNVPTTGWGTASQIELGSLSWASVFHLPDDVPTRIEERDVPVSLSELLWQLDRRDTRHDRQSGGGSHTANRLVSDDPGRRLVPDRSGPSGRTYRQC